MNTFTKNHIINNLKILILALILSAGITTISAWTNPPGSPPDCPTGTSGCDAPLHVGGSAQTKLGGLIVGSGVTATDMALYVPTGRIGFGVLAPTEKVHVSGNVRASGFCIGTDPCITGWPTGGSGGMGGSGTVNRIAKFTNTATLGNSMLYEANGKVIAEGQVQGTGLCMAPGGVVDCRTVWPSGGLQFATMSNFSGVQPASPTNSIGGTPSIFSITYIGVSSSGGGSGHQYRVTNLTSSPIKIYVDLSVSGIPVGADASEGTFTRTGYAPKAYSNASLAGGASSTFDTTNIQPILSELNSSIQVNGSAI